MSNAPEARTAGPLRVAGFATRTSNDREMAGAGNIAGVWQRLMGAQAPHPGRDAPVGVYFDYESDHTGEYTLLAGFPLAADESPPSGWDVAHVPGADYLVFRAEGEMPAALIAAWQRIWAYFDGDPAHARAFTCDFEQHGDHVDIHIAVEPR